VHDGVTETTCIAHDVLGSKYQQEIAAVFQTVSVVLEQSRNLENKLIFAFCHFQAVP